MTCHPLANLSDFYAATGTDAVSEKPLRQLCADRGGGGGERRTWPAAVKVTAHLCLTSSDQTLLNAYCKGPLGYPDQRLRSLGLPWG